ncbi:hypothetical protein cypCar_00017898 [Cyprinus carpio]|nr:hypothetical protein cypCar_00017898 [Cyprinus carpio]
MALRLAMVSFQGFCMLLDLISMVVVYHFRRNKRIKASSLILLEAILSGSVLLYLPVMIQYLNPSVFRCILLRWVRLLGFAIVYGTVILKLYRVLKVFLSRTAQRIPYMTSWRVLRLLAVILLVVVWFLVAWTSAVCQSHDTHHALIVTGFTPEGLQFSMCLMDSWDYMMAAAEFLFLLWGVYLCYAVRTVPSAFHEPRYLAVAIYNELLISAIFHIISHVKSQLIFISHVKSQLIFISHVKSQLIFLCPVKSRLIFISQVKPQLLVQSLNTPLPIFQSLVTSQLIFLGPVKSPLIFTSQVTADLHESSHR